MKETCRVDVDNKCRQADATYVVVCCLWHVYVRTGLIPKQSES